jgi:hypothetical protein
MLARLDEINKIPEAEEIAIRDGIAVLDLLVDTA